MSRFEKRPTGRLLLDSPKDAPIRDTLRRFHGLLPTPYIHAFVGGNYGSVKHRLKRMYHDGFDITRPPDQKLSVKANANHLTSQLTEIGWAKTERRFPLPPVDKIPHRLMRATIAASIALSLPKGYRFIDQEEIFTHKACPESTRRSKNPLAFPLPNGTWLEPDDLFGLEWEKDGKRQLRFFALEADRATESIYATKLDKTSYGRKLDGYRHVIRHCRDHWGIPKVMVMTVTSGGALRVKNMKEHLSKLTKETDAFIFRSAPVFSGPEWKAPHIMHELITDPWERVNGEPFFLYQ